jgi:WD40 repeat protein
VRTLPPAAVFSATLSPNDSRLFLQVRRAGSPSNGIGRAEVITLGTGRTVTLQTATPCGYLPEDISFSGDDSRIAGGSFCGFADVWNANTGRLLRQVNEGGEISGVSLSPDGSRLLVGSWDSRATIWSVARGRPLVELIGHTRGISAAVFAAGGSLVVTSALDRTVRVWNARTGQQLRVLTFTVDQTAIAVSPDGQQMAIGENTPVLGVDDVVRAFNTCPDCQDPQALLRLAAPHVTNQLTTLERTVIHAA